jgi:hypothetical protein
MGLLSSYSGIAEGSFNDFVSGFSNPFVDTFKFNAWKDDMTERLSIVFETAIPESARSKWHLVQNNPIIGDINEKAGCHWKIVDKTNNKIELFSVVFRNKAFQKGSQQYDSIEACLKDLKDESAEGWEEPYKWSITKISDTEALLEGDLDGGKDRLLSRAILKGNWLMLLEYEIKSTKPDSSDTWIEKRDIWRERLLKVNFN